MSLETLCVKTEVEEVCVKEEADEECSNEETGAHVKEEVECENSVGFPKLYTDHQIKDELELGPEELHRPCVASTLPVVVSRAEAALGRAGSGRLSRLPGASCRAGRRTCTLPSTHCTDTSTNTYQCDECGKEFRNKTVLRKHIHTHLLHTLPATLKRVKQSRGPRGDAEQVHVGGKRFKCSHCGYECKWKSRLLRHQRIHTGEKSFRCSHCDYKSNRKSILVSHERIHTGEKLFQCSLCNYKCRDKTRLRDHEMIHIEEKLLKCSLCFYECNRKTDLKRHEMIHTDGKPFKCSYCDYKCRQKAHLQNHERIHTGEKPFKCSHCDYKCTRKGYLKSHERIIHCLKTI